MNLGCVATLYLQLCNIPTNRRMCGATQTSTNLKLRAAHNKSLPSFVAFKRCLPPRDRMHCEWATELQLNLLLAGGGFYFQSARRNASS
eukprot:3461746-Amphidinium_carterae.1